MTCSVFVSDVDFIFLGGIVCKIWEDVGVHSNTLDFPDFPQDFIYFLHQLSLGKISQPLKF
jgi:hypothetical protein